jgi:hypothetical protein
MLRWYEAALLAIQVFVDQHLITNPDGSHPDAEAEMAVQTSAGKVMVTIRYPGGDLSELQAVPIWEPELEDDFFEEEQEDEEILFDRRVMEREMAKITSEMGAISPADDPDLAKAQELIYDAWENPNPKRRIALAHQAVKISSNCADAYNLLAEEEAKQ